MERYITTWRKTVNVFDWEHYVSESLEEAKTVVANIKNQGVHQYHTFPIGDAVVELSSEY